jgi:hypothetical protein
MIPQVLFYHNRLLIRVRVVERSAVYSLSTYDDFNPSAA